MAAFETGFHQTIPLKRQAYAIPHEWTEKLGIRRYGFHGASHRYIATRMKELAPAARKIISLHLGGSCSVCAIEDGKSVANSFGMTTQTGIPHAARVGDFDAFAMMKLLKHGVDLDTIWKKLGKEGGLLGMAGAQDMRDVEAKAAAGDARARLAVDVFVEACRHYLGAYLVALGGADAVVFTAGIGQNGAAIRAAILENLAFAGIVLDADKNKSTRGNVEARLEAAGSKGHPPFVRCATYSSRKYWIELAIGLTAPSASAQNERPRMLSHWSSSRSRSASLPWPFSSAVSTWTSHHVPSRHGVHLPQDSCL